MLKQTEKRKGFTLIEIIVGMAIFGVIVTGVLGVFSVLSRTVKASREKIIVSSLAAQNLEIVRNLPYSQVGTVNGNPPGSLPDLNNAQSITIGNNTYKIYYEVTYIDDPADGTILAGTDSAPNDYKQVKMFLQNVTSGVVSYFITNVSPQGLETLTNAGALLIKVIDANGQPLAGINLSIVDTQLNPNINLSRQTDASGQWVEVGLPDDVNGYHIVASKTGYSTDQTYPITQQNPNPTKPDATIKTGIVTQVTLQIDTLSNLRINTYDQSCRAISGVGVNVAGAKLIGTAPNVYKFNSNFTSDGNGQINLNNIEWDTYTPTLLTNQSYMVYGSSPIQQILVLPGTSQTFTLILGPTSTNSLLVIVKDAATGQPLEGATVHLQKGGSQPQDYYGTTGGSVWTQNAWNGGSGQVAFTDNTKYFYDDGNVSTNGNSSGIQLNKTASKYAASGIIESSTFDSGTATTNFTTLTWAPTSQNPATTLKFQIAANNNNTTWNYYGPDGTAATYYVTSGSTINSSHNNNRYVRYKAFLSTTDDKYTPVLTSVNVNYVAGCFTPGQSIFTSLTSGNNYNLDVSLTGYLTKTISSVSINGNQVLQILLGQ